jgi:hypothetical protein
MTTHHSTTGFRVSATLPMALVTDRSVVTDQIVPLAGEADAGLVAVTRISSREDGELKEALLRMVSTISALQEEVRALSTELRLSQIGVVLEPILVKIGPDGMSLHAPLVSVGDEVRVVLSLAVRGARQLMTLSAIVVGQGNRAELTFVSMQATQEKALVAYSFEQQGRLRSANLDIYSI